MTGMDLWSPQDTVSMIPWTVAAAAIIVAAALSYRRLRPRPCPRCALKQAEIEGLHEALEDARLTMLQRRHTAADLRTWGTARRERTGRRWWPGDNAGRLQVTYGEQEEPLDPCLSSDAERWPPGHDDRQSWPWNDDPTTTWPFGLDQVEAARDRLPQLTEQLIGLWGLEADTVQVGTVHIPQEAIR